MRATLWIGALGFLGVTADAGAHPTTDPHACTVTIVRAPDDVRAEIDRWVAEERSCQTTLEVRVVATEGGYYLVGRDGFGRIHERVVPDAQTAGVLVASWVADDSFVVAVPLEPMPVAHVGDRTLQPPGIAAVAHAEPAARPDDRQRTLSIGGVTMGVIGIRGAVDIVARTHWTFGAGLAFWMPAAGQDYDQTETQATASLAFKASRGPLHVRLHTAVGITKSSDYEFGDGSIAPFVELGAFVSYRRAEWGIVGGPMVTGFVRGNFSGSDTWQSMEGAYGDAHLTFFAGVERRL